MGSVKVNVWRKIFSGLLGFIFLSNSHLLPVSGGSTVPLIANVQPELLQFARTQPQTTVAVIIQKYGHDQAVENLVEQLGGKITKQLTIINGVAAELPAARLAELRQSPGVRWVSLDAPVLKTDCPTCVNTTNLQNTYNQTIHADKVWNEAPYLQGQGIGVAVVDSGIKRSHADFSNRVVGKTQTNIIPDAQDGFGHGSFVAGIIGGSGAAGQGAYIGVAPKTKLIDVRVTTADGISTESDVVAGLQWVYENRTTYNIRVVNLSLNASGAQSYQTSPLDAACEVLWFSGVVVVASVGNNGAGAIYPPANDPFVITVGATDEMGTVAPQDDTVATFSAYGTTADGFAKPDLVAPGRKLIGPLSSRLSLLALQHSTQVVNDAYIRMSGTSAAAPVVSGAVALLLQAEPNLTPDQVKYRLLKTANTQWVGYDPVKAGAGSLDIYAAIHTPTDAKANAGLPISNFLTTPQFGLILPNLLNGSLLNLSNDSVNWSSVNWSSVNWSSVNWSSVNWSSVDYWELDPVNLPLLGKLNLLSRSRADSVRSDTGNSANAPERTNTLFLPLVASETATP